MLVHVCLCFFFCVCVTIFICNDLFLQRKSVLYHPWPSNASPLLNSLFFFFCLQLLLLRNFGFLSISAMVRHVKLVLCLLKWPNYGCIYGKVACFEWLVNNVSLAPKPTCLSQSRLVMNIHTLWVFAQVYL